VLLLLFCCCSAPAALGVVDASAGAAWPDRQAAPAAGAPAEGTLSNWHPYACSLAPCGGARAVQTQLYQACMQLVFLLRPSIGGSGVVVPEAAEAAAVRLRK
jgi:hypothetical protein